MAAISVIIPALNAERTVAHSLHSLQWQDFGDWEAVVVDNGSEDGTAAVVAGVAANDPRIRVVKETKRGISAARNRGVRDSAAPLLLFLDADDTILPDHLQSLLAASDGRQGTIAYSGFRRMTREGRLLPPVFDGKIARDPFATFARRNRVQPHCLLIPRVLAAAAGDFDTGLDTCEDWDFWQRLARAGAIFVGVNAASAIYHMRAGSVSADLPRLVRDALRVLARACGPDPRVARPAPEFAAGIRDPDPTAPGLLILWAAAVSLAASGELPDELAHLPNADFTGQVPELVATVVSAIATGAEAGSDRLASVWSEMRERIQPLLEEVEAGSREKGLAQNILDEVERTLTASQRDAALGIANPQ